MNALRSTISFGCTPNKGLAQNLRDSPDCDGKLTRFVGSYFGIRQLSNLFARSATDLGPPASCFAELTIAQPMGTISERLPLKRTARRYRRPIHQQHEHYNDEDINWGKTNKKKNNCYGEKKWSANDSLVSNRFAGVLLGDVHCSAAWNDGNCTNIASAMSYLWLTRGWILQCRRCKDILMRSCYYIDVIESSYKD